MQRINERSGVVIKAAIIKLCPLSAQEENGNMYSGTSQTPYICINNIHNCDKETYKLFIK